MGLVLPRSRKTLHHSLPMLDNLSLLLAKALGFCLFLLVGGGMLFITVELLTHRAAPTAVVAFKAASHAPPKPHKFLH
jgi:hypothetical protein